MATLTYETTVATNSSTLSSTPTTGDLTGYGTTITIQSNKDIIYTVQYSPSGADDDFEDLENFTNIALASTTTSFQVHIGGYLRVNGQNTVGGETDTVTVKFYAVSASPTYCSAADVARHLQYYNSVTSSRLVFSSTTFPSLTEVNDMILEMEDFIDEVTNHAWRTQRVNDEIHNYEYPYDLGRYDRVQDNRSIKLQHRSIRQVVSGTHKLELWDGGSWDDLVANYTEGRDSDYWIDYQGGQVYFVSKYPSRTGNALRATYDYGEATVAQDIRLACALLVAERLLLTSDYHVSDAPNAVDEGRNIRLKSERFYERAMQILNERKEFMMVID
jgi:hypothetical protein